MQITDNSGLATSFEILVDGELMGVVNLEKLPTPTLSYSNGVLTITDDSGLSTGYKLTIKNSTSGNNGEHSGGSP